jgi:hypothetical protein
MHTHRRCLLSSLGGAFVCMFMAPAPAVAFDDQEFCAAAEQLALAAERDVGLWLDRITRNAGMRVFCDRKVIEFQRFSYLPSTSMDGAWTQRKAAEWSAAQCNSPVWTEASLNGWKITLHLTAADGGQVSLVAQCR